MKQRVRVIIKDQLAITENQFEGQVRQMAKMFGWLYYHTFLSKWSAAGFPDCILVRERVIYVELKSETGQLSPEQYEWLEALANAGQEVYYWRPSDFEDIAEILGS